MRISLLFNLFAALLVSLFILPNQAKSQFYVGANEQLFVTDVNGLNPTLFLDVEIGGLAIDTTRGVLFYVDDTLIDGRIQKISIDGTGQEELLRDTDLSLNAMAPVGLELDEQNMVVYIADQLNDGRILTVNYDGSNPAILIAGEPDGVTKGIKDVAVDTENNKLYWTKDDEIMRSDLNGENMEIVVEIDRLSGQGDNPVRANIVEVDPFSEKIYWADTFNNEIGVVNFDGTNKLALIDAIQDPIGLQLDLENQQIFWLSDGGFRDESINYRADLDGQNVQEIATYETPTFDSGPMVLYKYEIATSTEDEVSEMPAGTELRQNYPNPFNPTTQISFSLSEPGTVRLEVFNCLGQQVAVLLSDASFNSGIHSHTFNASAYSSGIYYYRLSVNGKTLTRSMTLLK